MHEYVTLPEDEDMGSPNLAAFLDQPVIEKFLTHLGLKASASDCFNAMNPKKSTSLMGRVLPTDLSW